MGVFSIEIYNSLAQSDYKATAKFFCFNLLIDIPGFELMLDLLGAAEAEGLSCYFIGAKEQVNEKEVEGIKKDNRT